MDNTTGDKSVYPFSQQGDSPSMAQEEGNINKLTQSKHEALRELREELSNMPHEEVSQYVHVQRKHPELVSDDSLLNFLRAEDFDTKLAAKRIAKYWEARQRIFGPDKFALSMTLNGAMKDSMKALMVGWLNLLPCCDERGRGVIYAESILVNSENFDSREQLRVFWYLMHVAMERPGVKETGIVIVANAEDTTLAHFDTQSATGICQAGDRLLPIRLVKFHLVHANPIFPLVAAAVRSFLTPRQRSSFVLHNGTTEMVLATLGKFGLPRDRLPKRIGGELEITASSFLNSRITIEGENHTVKDGGYSSSVVSPHDESSDSSIRDNEVCVGDDFSIEVEDDDFLIEPFEGEILGDAFQGIPSSDQNLVENQAVKSMDEHTAHVTMDVCSKPQPKEVPCSTLSEPATSDVEEEAQLISFGKINCAKKKISGTKVKKKKHFAKKSGHGRNGDPRMNRAVRAKLQNPQLPLVTALVGGGFVFPSLDEPGVKASALMDSDGVTLYQRRNQLLRRLRLEKEKAKSI